MNKRSLNYSNIICFVCLQEIREDIQQKVIQDILPSNTVSTGAAAVYCCSCSWWWWWWWCSYIYCNRHPLHSREHSWVQNVSSGNCNHKWFRPSILWSSQFHQIWQNFYNVCSIAFLLVSVKKYFLSTYWCILSLLQLCNILAYTQELSGDVHITFPFNIYFSLWGFNDQTPCCGQREASNSGSKMLNIDRIR